MGRVLFAIMMVCAAGTAMATEPAPYQGVFRIGTASKVGTFYGAANAICKLVNQSDPVYCVPVVTNGSLHNLNLLVSGKLDFAIVKADVVLALDHAGMSDKAREKVSEVRVIAKLHDMPLSIINRRGEPAEFNTEFARNYTLNIGLEGSGERIASEELFMAMGLELNSLSTTTFNSRDIVDAFCNGDTDVAMELIAHPAQVYNRLINECDGQFMNLSPLVVSEVSAINPYVFRTLIYGGFYSEHPETFSTYAVSALLIANANLDPTLRDFVADFLRDSFYEVQDQLPEWVNMVDSDLMVDAPPSFIWD